MFIKHTYSFCRWKLGYLEDKQHNKPELVKMKVNFVFFQYFFFLINQQ